MTKIFSQMSIFLKTRPKWTKIQVYFLKPYIISYNISNFHEVQRTRVFCNFNFNLETLGNWSLNSFKKFELLLEFELPKLEFELHKKSLNIFEKIHKTHEWNCLCVNFAVSRHFDTSSNISKSSIITSYKCLSQSPIKSKMCNYTKTAYQKQALLSVKCQIKVSKVFGSILNK